MAQKKKTLPVVAAIINDLELIDGHVLLGAEKLKAWSQKLKAEHWGTASRDVYLQLGGYALELAKRGAPAALEFVALATLPDAARERAKTGEKSAFTANPGLKGKVEQVLGSRAEMRAPTEEKAKSASTPKPKRGLR